MIHALRMPKWNEVLIAIHRSQDKDRYCERLNRAVKTSRSHLREIIKLLEKNGLIERQPSAKTNKISLTSKGQQVARQILEVRAALSRL